MELPKEVIETIKSFIPRDRDMKSPTSDCIKHLVLYDIHLINFQKFPHMTFIQHAFMAIRDKKLIRYLNWLHDVCPIGQRFPSHLM